MTPCCQIQRVRINRIHRILPLFPVLEESIAEIGGGCGADSYDAGLEEEEVEGEGKEEY